MHAERIELRERLSNGRGTLSGVSMTQVLNQRIEGHDMTPAEIEEVRQRLRKIAGRNR